ncbi:MAG: acyl-CoA dehydrogenase [Actinobacteria bacterium]|nr:acyl-CoA dehydrogenase [Actinomycetota bacterium]MBI3686507.1 acyl-CoA dehydrogenase [Actinomycetota bacterium]
MGHYKSNLRDLEFNLFELFAVNERLGSGVFADIDEDTARSFLHETERLAAETLAETFADGDRVPPAFDPETGTVLLPEPFKRSFRALMDSGMFQLDLPEALGGVQAPRTLCWALAELVLGANPAAFIYAAGPAFASIFWRLGTAEQRGWARIFVDKGWGATMMLTEPDAGSDVGAGRTRAVPQPDGSWHLEGVKRFITSAEHDLSDNIIHYVLARPVGVEGAGGPGTKGLSLFVVPKFLFDPQTGELGERNGAYVTNVEHKMGLKVSTTCEVSFGDRRPAVGWLVGEVHDGIAQMFKIVEYARMMVGTKAIATLSTGYLNALDFAKSRVQGADLARMADKTAPRVTITHHPDVRRMLMLQKAYTEGLRALYLYTATQQDAVLHAEATGEPDSAADRLNDLLLPIVKGFGSEKAYELLAQSLQILGGSGYLQDYPIEQYIRDAKIDTLYEGTTGIQSLDLFFRKIVRDKGQALTAVSIEIESFVHGEDGDGRLKDERILLGQALAEVQAMVGAMIGQLTSTQEDARNIYKVGQNTVTLLMSLGDLLVGWLLQRQATIAITALDGGATGPDQAFYEGKVGAARFFAHTVLPELSVRRRTVEATDLSLMELPEDAF